MVTLSMQICLFLCGIDSIVQTLEKALQAVLPNGDVALHYWDQTDENLKEVFPPILKIKMTK